jgi:dynein heavy chain
LNILNIQL